MINVGFKNLAPLTLLLAAGISSSTHAQELPNVTWTTEYRDTPCQHLQYDMPTSMVPIPYGGTPARDPEWHSFDGHLLFLESQNEFHELMASPTKKEYLSWPRCKKSGEEKRCVEDVVGRKKMYFSADNGDYGALCGYVKKLGDGSTRKAPTIVDLMFCGPKSDDAKIEAVTKHMFDHVTLEVTKC